MARAITAKVTGLSELKSSLKKYLDEIAKRTDEGLQKGAEKIALSADIACELQSVASTIRTKKEGKTWRVMTDGEISAYLEFGTGNYAKALLTGYPEDWREMARRFYINGLGRTPSQPYFYPSYVHHKPHIIEDIKKSIEEI